MDSGTAFGEHEGGIAVGAMSYAFLRALRRSSFEGSGDTVADVDR